MSEIDAEKLAAAIDAGHEEVFGLRRYPGCDACINANHLSLLLEASKVTLRSLPRFKEVEVVQWAVITDSGSVVAVYDESRHGMAQRHAAEVHAGRQVVRLTGTAKVRA